jgi:hypothetical protein
LSYSGSLAFFDDRDLSETYGELLACCPRCGARLAAALAPGRLGDRSP